MEKFEEQLQLLPASEQALRFGRLTALMAEEGIDAMLVSDNANIFYLTGRVFCGFVYLHTSGNVIYFVRRPSTLQGDNICRIRKPEDMDSYLKERPSVIALELDSASYASATRLGRVFEGARMANASGLLRKARSVKTPLEIKMMEESGVRQTEVYRQIPHLYQEGMSDVEFQIEIERALRLAGCLGQFRITGTDMELYMGNVLVGENADTPSPYDFAMGGAGMSPSLPVGANGSIIKPGQPVMVDVNGNFTGYMTDMTRCYSLGRVSDECIHALETSRAICAAVAQAAVPGAEAKALYELSVQMAADAGLSEYFMGHRYHAGFVGHGLGIAVNEAPVLAPRSRDVLVAGNAIAVEPKFVIPGIGAVGIENTYIVEDSSPARRLTNAPEEIVELK